MNDDECYGDKLLSTAAIILSTQPMLPGCKQFHAYVAHSVKIAAHLIDCVNAHLQANLTELTPDRLASLTEGDLQKST